MRCALSALLFLALAPAPVAAHPHEFVAARIDPRFDDQGRLVALDVEWRYDELTSMLILSDVGLNPAATDLGTEQAPELQGFDLDWVPGYNGDLWPYADGIEIPLGPPRPGAATVEGGQVVSRHLRPLAEPVDPRAVQVVVQVYDPEFYIAYTIAQGPGELPQIGCRLRIFEADLDAAYTRLQAMLDELTGGSGDIESDFPRVGRDFADELRIDCGPPAAQPEPEG